VPAGRPISYGKRWRTTKPTKIATLPIGYGDGYPRVLSNKANVLIRGQRAPVVGTVCMDQIMVDVGHIPQVSVGDEVVLLGKQGNEQISAEELAGLAGTIPYEIVCSIAPRVPRVYIDRGQGPG
jgi:alanine racemase